MFYQYNLALTCCTFLDQLTAHPCTNLLHTNVLIYCKFVHQFNPYPYIKHYLILLKTLAYPNFLTKNT